ncbi:MAG: flagellar basal-body MS-ring/collar protein FliF [Thermodesulfobacteriota bacterium]
MAGPREIIEQLITAFKGLSLLQKLIFLGVVLAAVAVLVTLSAGGGQSDMKVLFSGMAQDDGAAVVARLKEQRVPYVLENDGTVIKVPADRVHETRLALAGEGLPRGGGIGFEIFDKQSFGTTDFVQKLNYQRALQGELARTISQMEQVESARVHIATPKESVFIEDAKEPSASVVVKLRGREKLSSVQIKSVVNLVAAAVPGLSAENVTVVDTAGRLLYRKQGEDGTMLSASQLEYQYKVEETLRRKVETMLEEVVGVDRARARVTAQLDFDKVNVTEELFDPDGQVVRSEQNLTEENRLGPDQPQGIPGVKGNLATFAESGAEAAAGGEGSRRNNSTRNYEISKTVRQVQAAAGVVKRLSVAVMVDGTYERGKDEKGNETTRYVARSKEEIDNFVRIVRNAIGYDPDRGDQVEVVGVPFALSQVVEPVASPVEKWGGLIDKLAMPLVYLCMVIAVFLFVIKPFFRLMSEKQQGPETVAVRAEGVPMTPEEEEELKLAPKKMTDKERIYKLAKSDPDRAADLVRRWLREEM